MSSFAIHNSTLMISQFINVETIVISQVLPCGITTQTEQADRIERASTVISNDRTVMLGGERV